MLEFSNTLIKITSPDTTDGVVFYEKSIFKLLGKELMNYFSTIWGSLVIG